MSRPSASIRPWAPSRWTNGRSTGSPDPRSTRWQTAADLLRKQVASIEQPQWIQPPLHQFHRLDLLRRVLEPEKMAFPLAEAMLRRNGSAERNRTTGEIE